MMSYRIPYNLRFCRRCPSINISCNRIFICGGYIIISVPAETREIYAGNSFILPIAKHKIPFKTRIEISVMMKYRHLCIGSLIISIHILKYAA